MLAELERSIVTHKDFLAIVVNVATLVVVSLYTKYTKQTLDLALERETKPILLREGHFDFSTIPFVQPNGAHSVVNIGNVKLRVERNIVTNISGYVIVSGNKYELLFFNQVTTVSGQSNSQNLASAGAMKTWSWLPEKGDLSFVGNMATQTSSQEKNQLVIFYHNTGGQLFRLLEDENYTQTIKAMN